MPLILQRYIDEEIGTVFHLEGFRDPTPYKSHKNDVFLLVRVSVESSSQSFQRPSVLSKDSSTFPSTVMEINAL